MNLKSLVNGLAKLDDALKRKATGAINIAHTLRNWLFGYYVVEYEQRGEDRAKYGDQILENISEGLKGKVKGTSVTNLRLFRQFYQTYPQIGQSLTVDSVARFVADTIAEIGQTLSDVSADKPFLTANIEIHQAVSDESFAEHDLKKYFSQWIQHLKI